MEYQNNKKILTLIVPLVCYAFLLSGCAFKDIDKRIFAIGIAVDSSDEEQMPYKVTLKLAVPSGSMNDEGPTFTYISANAATISEAIRKIETKLDKELDFSHAKVIVFGKAVINKGRNELLDFFFRRRDIQLISYVAIGEPTGEKIIKLDPDSQMTVSSSLANIFSEIANDSPFIVSTYLFDLRRKLIDKGIDSVLPIIEVDEKDKKFSVDKSMIFTKKTELNLELDTNQTLYYNFLTNNASTALIPVQNDKHHFTMFVDTIDSKFKLITTKDSPIIKIDVTMAGIIEESFAELSISKLDEYSKSVKEEVQKKIEGLLTELQEKNVDPIGFGLRYLATNLHNHHTDHYEDWQKMYPNAKFDVNVKVGVKSTGTIE